MALPATLPPWIQGANPGMFGRGLQLGEEMRANRAAEQYKQQEMMRQRQQDQIAQQNHQEEVQRDLQRQAIQDQQWKQEFGLRQQENKARIEEQAAQAGRAKAAAETAAAKSAAQAALNKALAEWAAKPEHDQREYFNIIARYGPAAGINIASMLAQQAKPPPPAKLAPAAKPTGPKPLTEEQRDRAIDRRQKQIDKYQEALTERGGEIKDTDSPATVAMKKDTKARIDVLQSEIEKLESGQELYGQPSDAAPQQPGPYQPLRVGRGGTIGGGGTAIPSWSPDKGWSDQPTTATPAAQPVPAANAPPPAYNPLTQIGAGGFDLGQRLAKIPKPAAPPAPDPAPVAAQQQIPLVKMLLDRLRQQGAQIPPDAINQPPASAGP